MYIHSDLSANAPCIRKAFLRALIEAPSLPVFSFPHCVYNHWSFPNIFIKYLQSSSKGYPKFYEIGDPSVCFVHGICQSLVEPLRDLLCTQ